MAVIRLAAPTVPWDVAFTAERKAQLCAEAAVRGLSANALTNQVLNDYLKATRARRAAGHCAHCFCRDRKAGQVTARCCWCDDWLR